MDRLYRWPDDYLPLDGGRLLARPDFAATLARLGLDTAASVMAADRCEVIRRVGRRDNCRLVLPDADGSVTRAYLKRHFAPNGRRGPGLREADAVGWCQAAQTPTMSVVGAGQNERGPTNTIGSFFISEEIAGGVPADDLWKLTLDGPTRRQILRATAATARVFHAAGYCHRDFYWCHFFIRPHLPFGLTAHLIDLQRVRRLGPLKWRWLVKDLGQFWFSAPKDVSAAERRYWLACYRGQRAADETRGWHRFKTGMLDGVVRSRANFYRWKDAA